MNLPLYHMVICKCVAYGIEVAQKLQSSLLPHIITERFVESACHLFHTLCKQAYCTGALPPQPYKQRKNMPAVWAAALTLVSWWMIRLRLLLPAAFSSLVWFIFFSIGSWQFKDALRFAIGACLLEEKTYEHWSFPDNFLHQGLEKKRIFHKIVEEVECVGGGTLCINGEEPCRKICTGAQHFCFTPERLWPLFWLFSF